MAWGQVSQVPLKDSPEHLAFVLLLATGFLALRFPTVLIHVRRGNPEDILGQILGDVQLDRW